MTMAGAINVTLVRPYVRTYLRTYITPNEVCSRHTQRRPLFYQNFMKLGLIV